MTISSPDKPKLTPILINDVTRRAEIHRKALSGIQEVFPIKVKNHTIEVANLRAQPKEFSSQEQKDAILRGSTLQEPLKGDILLKDPEGKVIEQKKSVILAHLPYFTQRHTFIVDGNEYSVSNQRRIRPGVYTRIRANEELEAMFNLGRGENFRINMDPAKGHLFMQYGSSNIPLYPVLRGLGVTDKQLAKNWGQGVVDQNKGAFSKKEENAIDKLYERLVPAYNRTATTHESKIQAIHDAYKNTVLDPEVTEKTLGTAFPHVTPDALLSASKKLLDVHRSGQETDDRDSLAFQTLHTVDDFIKERIQLEGRNLARKISMKASGVPGAPTLASVPSTPFSKSLRSFMTTAALSSIPTQINPIEILDSASRITNLGEGGISSERAVPGEARSLHHTHFGFIDPARTPESFRAGIDLRAAITLKRDENGKMHALMVNARTGKHEDVSVNKLVDATVAFPGELKKKNDLSALRNGELVSVPRHEVDYELPDPSLMYSVATNTVPMPEGLQGNRLVMAGKFSTQALPLIHREAPLVQVAGPQGRSFERSIIADIVPTSPVAGTIEKVDKDYIYVRPQQRKTASVDGVGLGDGDCGDRAGNIDIYMTGVLSCPEVLVERERDAEGDLVKLSATDVPLIKIPYETNFPLASKTYLNHDVQVKAGDKVHAGQFLGSSNFTKDDTLALGTNLTVGYVPYYGLNANDAVVISESASKKLTSEHMYKEALQLDNDIVMSKDKHRAMFGNRWTAQQYNNLDAQGLAKPKAKVNPGDPLILVLRHAAPTAEQQMLGRLHKTLARPFREEVVTWDHRESGEVVEVVTTPQRVLITVKTQESAGIGDKVSNRSGSKGVIAKIIPDDQMLRTRGGKVLDLLLTSTGVGGRVNPAQIIETAVAKVAEKTGKPVLVPQYSGRNNVKWAKNLLKEHGISDKEILFNPVSGKEIRGLDGKGVMVGPQYTYKLFKSTETNYSARGVDDYDVNLQPAKGGTEGAKAFGRMEINALLGHNARNVLQEAATIKGSKNDEFWRAYQLGLPLPPVKTPFVFDKFTNMLMGAGVKVDKSDQHLILGPLTDKDVTKLSAGEIKKAVMVREKDLAPEQDGLFDTKITGGTNGERWSHITLTEPIVNPTFEDPVRRLLGMTQTKFDETLRKEGGAGIKRRLAKLDINAHEKALNKKSEEATGSALDSVVKQLKTIRALKRAGLAPHEAFILNKLPVVPPASRPILPSKGKKDLLIADANYLYRDTMLANSALSAAKESLPEEELGKARAHLYDTTRALFGLAEPTSPQLKGRATKGFISAISGEGSPKFGFFHSKLLKIPQDLTARGTAAPDPALHMDEVGLPRDMIWSMYEPHIMRRLVQNGYQATEAKQMVKDRHPVAQNFLDVETKERPVMINRAPTLHRFSILAAYPKAIEGKTIRVSPFIEKSQNLDFDGDSVDCELDSVIEGCYRRLHIKDFPRLEESRTMHENKEVYKVPAGCQVFSYDPELGHVRLMDVTEFSVHHDLQMLDVAYTSGRTVRVSKDASLFALNPATNKLERATAEDVKKVNWGCPRPRQLYLTAVKDSLTLSNGKDDELSIKLDQQLGWFFGALAGNGWQMFSRDRETGVGFAQVDVPVREEFVKIAKRFDPCVSQRDYSNTHTWDGSNCYSEKIHLNSALLGRYITCLLGRCQGAANKKLPPVFLQAPREFHLGLFTGLLDTDGSICRVQAKVKNKPQWLCSYTTVSKELAENVATLLTILRIRNGVCFHADRSCYTITISTLDLYHIAPELKLFNPKKAQRLTEFMGEFDPNNNNNVNRSDVIPITSTVAKELARTLGTTAYPIIYTSVNKSAKTNRLSRRVFNELRKLLGDTMIQDIGTKEWFDIVTNEEILWDFVETVTPLPGRHTAWDLTIPEGSHTFMTSQQVLVYDTLQIHTPVTSKAVEEVKAMLPSSLLFGDKSKTDLLVFPQHEAVLGNFLAAKATGGKTHKYKNKEEAMAAYRRGDIDLHDTVEIP